jgi:drug/metabolite transporter (DMT)-like permease
MTTTTRKTTVAKVDKPTARKPKRSEVDNLPRWAHAYVALAAGLSMVLNAMANCHHSESKLMAGTMGALIPVLVLLLGRVAGLLYRRKRKQLAYVVGGIGVVLLLLSVFHCTESIGELTGSNWLLSAALAVGIDCGLVACEVVAVVED